MEKKIKVILLVVILLSLSIKIMITDWSIPVENDARLYYYEATNYLYKHGLEPKGYEKLHNVGFPIILSGIFYFFEYSQDDPYLNLNTFSTIQKVFTIVLSCILIPISYSLCRKFYDEKISLIGSIIIAFEPHLILNSTLGITEPLFLIFIFTSLFFMFRNSLLFAILFAIFAMFVRFEGIVLLLIISIWFIKEYQFKKSGILLLLLLPITISILIIEDNGIKQKLDKELLTLTTGSYITFERIINSILYMGWVTFPSFIFLLPIGFIKVKDRKYFLLFTIILLIPPLWAYLDAYDTRYFFLAFPILLIISLATIKHLDDYIHSKKNLLHQK